MSWIGRGNECVPGKPLGWSHHQEREEIRAHLRRRIWQFGFDHLASFRLEQRVSAIQARLHKNKPTYRERSAAFAAKARAIPDPVIFTAEELERIAEHFAGANDPLAQAIHTKARRA